MRIIKELEWQSHTQIHVSTTPFGEYVVRKHSPKLYTVCSTPYGFGVVMKLCENATLAKKAAQDNFEKKINEVLK